MSEASTRTAPPPADDSPGIETPPVTVGGILRRLGPGLIVAGSIVGSGELIATTKAGAEAGFWLLWLIVIGCVIKVFVQVEFGRFSIVNGQSTMEGLNHVPGPVFEAATGRQSDSPRMRGNWIVWYWFLMWFASIGQLGGIVGGVGQAMAISVPLTQAQRDYNAYVDQKTQLAIQQAEVNPHDQDTRLGKATWHEPEDPSRPVAQPETCNTLPRVPPPTPYDDRWWAAITAGITAILLVAGRFGLIQNLSTAMVCGFTLITMLNLVLLQSHPSWAISIDDILQGLQFRTPPHSDSALATALATFGIIGVGAAEIIAYPYWCIEKGYARFTGVRNQTPEWAERARGWMRVMRWDAWISMVVYTFATVAFYLLGAAILGRSGLDPEKSEMIRTLAVIYEPVFGRSARLLFLIGAFAVLYSTYFVANAAHARVFSDTLGVLGAASREETAHRRRVLVFSGLFPLLCLGMYVAFPNPAELVLISGVMQAVMLPMLAIAGLYFRYYRNDSRLMPGRWWDVFLWLSAVGMFVAGIWALISKLS